MHQRRQMPNFAINHEGIFLPMFHLPWDVAGAAALIIVYTVGILGILRNVNESFIYLTPINLLFSVFVVLALHYPKNRNFWLFVLLAYTIGLGIEVIGVNTGQPFGSYAYSDVLGPKVWSTPLIIGANWLMLTYCIGNAVQQFFPRRSWIMKATIGALLMVLLDFLIEPVAIKYGFWSWSSETIPAANYLTWMVVAFVIMTLFYQLLPRSDNKVALVLLFLQFGFFLILGNF